MADIYIKRIVGMPGDVISLETDENEEIHLCINGAPTDEDYCTEETYAEEFIGEEFTVPDGCYFMLGDNRENSYDSRYWENKYLPRGNILGKAIMIYWPTVKFL